jgi:hypothetical protein
MKHCVKFDTSKWEMARKRLYWKYRREGSFDKLARQLDVNVNYIYKYIAEGTEPKNKEIARTLGIPRRKEPVTVNRLMAKQTSIQDTPLPLLRLMFENRVEMERASG